jgi:hypothetical protein
MTTTAKPSPSKHSGGCHCGVVRYEAEVDPATGSMCNCSVCTKLATVGAIVKPAAFRLIRGEDALASYVWGHKIGERKFCKHCGTHCFGTGHLEQLGGDYVSINLNTLDDFDLSKIQLAYWDGRHDNWQAGLRPAPWPVTA